MTETLITASVTAAARPQASPGPVAEPTGDGASFAAMAGEVLSALAQQEATVKAGLADGADPQAVVQALAQTEIAVQTAVAVRDRAVEAYQEILRMPV